MSCIHKQVAPVVLITGAARRIGAEIARHLHAANFNIIIQCHNSLQAGQVLTQNFNRLRPNSACLIHQNLHEPNAATKLIETALSWGTRLDLLVNNACKFTPSVLLSQTLNNHRIALQAWDELFYVNVKLPFLLSIAAYPHLQIVNGSIINISDIYAVKPLKKYAVYCQTQAALTMQTKALAYEFAPDVRVNAIAPGAIIWPERENILDSKIQKKIIADTPLKKHGDPFYIAQAVLSMFENPFITGQTLNVDGGRSII